MRSSNRHWHEKECSLRACDSTRYEDSSGGASEIAANSWQWTIARYNFDGSLDTSFGTPAGPIRTGYNVLPISSNDLGASIGLINDDFAQFSFLLTANKVAVQADGKIIVAGTAYSNNKYRFAVARLLSDGSLDTSYNGTSILLIPVKDINDYSAGLALQADGKIVLGGSAQRANGQLDFAVARVYGSCP